jgi:Fe/S biogenesis protein NfuA
MIQLSDVAKKRIETLMKDQIENHEKTIKGLRLTTSGTIPNVEYALAFVEDGKNEAGDISVESNGVRFYMESHNAKFLEDIEIDFVENLEKSGFKIENPKVIKTEAAPEVPDSSADFSDPVVQAVQKVLDADINPSIASHGGHITLVGVKNQVAYVRLGGGCQGCGQANVTLQQGVVVAIKNAVPEIKDVLDVTNHSVGSNPYYA